MKSRLLPALALCAALGCGIAQAADPTLQEIYQAASAGRMDQAESMMQQVLRDHPNSAKAHFVEAELMLKAGRPTLARSELATAERLAPGLPFAKPAAVAELKQGLAQPARAAAPALAPTAATAAHLPWGLILLGCAVLAGLFFFLRALRRPQLLPAGGPAYASGYGPGYGPGYGGGPVAGGGGLGSGLMGGLATGAAMGAGLVAGEALMHRVLDGGTGHAATDLPLQSPTDYATSGNPGHDLGGVDFGISGDSAWDDNSSWDDGSALGGDDWN